MPYETLLYGVEEQVATITLNRPEALNTSVPPMPDEVEAAVTAGVRDGDVKVIVVRGAGRAFCAGYDFGGGFHHWDAEITTDGRWDPGKDFVGATAPALAPTQKFMSVWRSPSPVIAQVHGWCVGGGSDFALCADLVIASEDARIGTPYSRMWGAYLSGMWLYRLGLTQAKELALTGRPLSGAAAARIELVTEAVPFAELEETVRRRARELASIPASQLAAMKLIVNQAYEHMGSPRPRRSARSSTASCATRRTPSASSSAPPAMASPPPSPIATGRSATTARRRRTRSPIRDT